MNHSFLFTEKKISNLSLKNRFVRSATFEGLAEQDGSVTEKLKTLWLNLAKGDVGLIITGYTYVSHEGRQSIRMNGLMKKSQVASLKQAVDSVHQAGSKIIMQLVHVGGQVHDNLNETRNEEIIGPSAMEHPLYKSTCREMTKNDIQNVIQNFANSALLVKKAGFDGVQIHAAHGYLINQFLSPATNKRTDEYGGSIENRSRFLIDIYKAIKTKIEEYEADGFLVTIKINSEDFVENGVSLEDSLYCAKELEKLGLDAIEISGGTPVAKRLGPSRMRINKPENEAYFRDNSKRFMEELNIPVILVGGFRSFELCEKLVEENYCDFISMSRPFVREPALVKRWQNENREKAHCVSCNRCFKEIYSDEGVSCHHLKK